MLLNWLLCSIAALIEGAPTFDSRRLDIDQYLGLFGYLPQHTAQIKSSHGEKTDTARKSAIRRFQKYNGLKVSGILDDQTYHLMTVPRCGIPDYPDDDEDRETNNNITRPLQYVLTGPKWKKKTIRWGVSKYTNQIPPQAQIENFKTALNMWQEVSQLRFIYTTGERDIDIKFVKRDHGDNSPFDGRSLPQSGRVLAHAFPPGEGGLSGDAHFDDDELWTTDLAQEDQVYIEIVAAHEFGHSLGLHHSKKLGALMSAYYMVSKEGYKLNQDDVNGIQNLYGEPEHWQHTIRGYIATRAPDIPSCSNLFQAVVWGNDGKAHGILTDQVYLLNGNSKRDGYPKMLQDVYPGAPVGVDFAFTVPRDRVTYMFMATSYWRFRNYRLDPGYPKPFDIRVLPETPVTAVATAKGIFMFGTTKFWRWQENSQVGVRGTDTSKTWSHSPAAYELVTTWINGDVYLINSRSHVKLKTDGTSADSGYPRQGVPEWILKNCPNGANITRDSGVAVVVANIIVLFALCLL